MKGLKVLALSLALAISATTVTPVAQPTTAQAATKKTTTTKKTETKKTTTTKKTETKKTETKKETKVKKSIHLEKDTIVTGGLWDDYTVGYEQIRLLDKNDKPITKGVTYKSEDENKVVVSIDGKVADAGKWYNNDPVEVIVTYKGKDFKCKIVKFLKFVDAAKAGYITKKEGKALDAAQKQIREDYCSFIDMLAEKYPDPDSLEQALACKQEYEDYWAPLYDWDFVTADGDRWCRNLRYATPESVEAAIAKAKAEHPDGSHWGSDTYYEKTVWDYGLDYKEAGSSYGTFRDNECSGFMAMLTDYATDGHGLYTDATIDVENRVMHPFETTDYSQIQKYDIVETANHVMLVVEVAENGIYVAHGNSGGKCYYHDFKSWDRLTQLSAHKITILRFVNWDKDKLKINK